MADTNAPVIYYMPHSSMENSGKIPRTDSFHCAIQKEEEACLNDGSKKFSDIYTCLHFRQRILTCDIEAAFTQRRLVNAHKDLCRFLWLVH